MFVQTPPSRSRAISWRVVATVSTAALVYVLTRDVGLSVAVGALDAIVKIVLWPLHERAWSKRSLSTPAAAPGHTPAVLWFTGLSGSGKSTIAQRIYSDLERRGHKVEYLDGDRIRDIFPTTGFSKAERDLHVKRVGHLASTLERNGVLVIAAFISPYAETRDFVRGLCDRFVEIFVSTPLAVCEKRDVKGLYAKARRGEITQFTGIDDPYEAPTRAEITIDTSRVSLDEATDQVTEYLERHALGAAG
ncbi:MAG: adenylyl-sulfate kinase [Vicinamibacterales bacterium]|jgi:adenylylsulfate kinase|nr:adenylyl-sulfate kinase [Acidobacteriota bacterium]MDP7295566.1 adenylyl-sulfate kinase [Vicinamibacterales bacterium]MDP7472814.1 adenylyl-sulfate kinase [Vicinamibacterales bacterium]MDP7671514.1 adenylyl-sulfate kinase [Vicinamibacterales bacterium]HJO39445.1 adenylyl-sulfate kinase [Vicinamibacterales bacterium]|tara:strand:- start:10487 stop:11230 length:744 start_codon:yes stop_codon:yes gene_type:complete